MKGILKYLLAAACMVCRGPVANGQNISVNILVRNGGKVNTGENVYLELTICNLDAAVAVPAYKLKPQISVPADLVSIPERGHQLPAGWAITARRDGQVWLSNGTDTLAAGDCRTLLLALHAHLPGGPSTVAANLLFANGMAPGNVTGSQLPGDSPADNHSTSTVTVLGRKRK